MKTLVARTAGEGEQTIKRLGVQHPPVSTPFFCLAMAYQANGQRALARETFHRGVKRLQETYPEAPLIKLLRDEAAKKIGVDL